MTGWAEVFGVLQLPGSCWLLSMPNALKDGVSWGGGVMGAGEGKVGGGSCGEEGGSQLKAVVENQAK